MKRYLLLCIMIIQALAGICQARPCKDYEKMMKDARDLTKRGSYDSALASYASAIKCNPEKKDEINNLIDEVKLNKNLSRKKNEDKSFAKIITPNIDNHLSKREKDSDSSSAGSRFMQENNNSMKELSATDKNVLKADVARLTSLHRLSGIDSLKSYLWALDDAKFYDSIYTYYVKENKLALREKILKSNRKDSLTYYSLKLMDFYSFKSWVRLEMASKMLPPDLKNKYASRLSAAISNIESHRIDANKDYRMPDTLVNIPSYTLFRKPCTDNTNFTWAYLNYDDYKKVQIRFYNLSLPGFSFTIDSTVNFAESGAFENILATTGNYQYQVCKEVNYALKKSKTDYLEKEEASPGVKKLTDRNGNILLTLDKNYSNFQFFSPDGNYMASWKSPSQLFLFDLIGRKMVPLTNNDIVPTESISSDSKTIAYYNSRTGIIYISDMKGNNMAEIPGNLTGIYNINNIDFTGGNKFLKVNNEDSISLFEISNKRIVMRLSKPLVEEIIVSPNGKDALITINTRFISNKKFYSEHVAILSDLDLNIKDRLYSEAEGYFFTPSGDYIIGYNETAIMRWTVNKRKTFSFWESCMTLNELVKYNCLPLSAWSSINDADLIEKGARAYRDLAETERIPMQMSYYLRQSRFLWNRLIQANARNIRKERIPFFYDWYNWLERRMGYSNFSDQFVKQMTAVKVFDRLVNSPDSSYPEQLYYAANGNMIFENLYDSISVYNEDYIELIAKEIGLRQKVFDKDPENTDNIYYYIKALGRLSSVCDTVGWRHLINGRYKDRFAIYSEETAILKDKMRILPDSFQIRTKYINSLAQLGASYLYVFLDDYPGKPNYLEKAILSADKALSLNPSAFDSARILIVKARAYLLEPGNFDKSFELYRLVSQHFPQLSKATMLNQLLLLKEAGFRENESYKKIEEFLKRNETK